MHIGLVLNNRKPGIPEAVSQLGIIADRLGRELLLKASDGEKISARRGIRIVEDRAFLEQSELLLAVGGDGTVLKAAHLSLKHKVPVAGINLGRLGFLSTLEKGEENRLEDLLNGSFRVQKRRLVQAQKESGPVILAVNELCFQREALAKLPDFSLACDGCDLGNFRADGLLFSTPTGSTAYSMAAGGPICAPDAKCLIMTPICPFGPRQQPLIFSDESSIHLLPHIKNGSQCVLLADGRDPVSVENGDVWSIRTSDAELKLVQLENSRFFKTCVRKIWGDDLR